MPDRRKLLAMLVLSPFALSQGANAQTACGGTLSMSDKNRRRALGYVEISPSKDRRCGLCTFFTAQDGGCGACQMLSGKSVSEMGVCNSYVAKGS